MAIWPFRSRTDTIEEAAPTAAPGPADVKRVGYEYGIPDSGMREYSQSLGEATNTDRRSFLTQLYDSYLACPWSWAAVNAIARTITAGGLVTDWDGNDGEGDQEPPEKPANVLALERLFKYTNPREDIRQLMRSVIADLLVFGDAFIEVVWLANVPVALFSLDCPSMNIIADAHGDITGFVQLTEFNQRAEFETRDVIHISLDSPRSGLFGVSPTQAALLPITAWLFAAATLKEVFRKGNPPIVHVDMPQGMQQPEINRWTSQHMQRFVGPRNIGFPLVTKGGANVTELQHARVDEYLHVLDQKRDEILANYGTPPALAGVHETGSIGGNVDEAQRKIFRTNTCDPIAGLVTEKLNFHLAHQGFGITDWHIKFKDIDMRDSEVVERIRDMRLRNGSWTLDKYRAEIGEPPVDGGANPVLVDRQNLVLWRDIETYSTAEIAAKTRGSALEPDEHAAGSPVTLSKPAPKPVPPALAAHAGLPAPTGEEPPPERPAGSPPPPGPPAGRPPREARRHAARPVRESYQQRVRRALAELPR